MSKCAIYVRVSTTDKQSNTRQISDLTTLAKQQGYTDDDIVIFEDKISGYSKKDNRPALSDLLNKIDEDVNQFEMIYITEISRLGRNPRQVGNIIDDLTEKKIPIFIQSLGQATLINGVRNMIMRIIIMVLSEFADAEVIQSKIRFKSGLLEGARKGNVGGGKYLPYGFKKGDNKELLVDDEESLIIIRIFELYKSGLGFRRIAGYLNDDNIPTRVAKFGKQEMNFKTPKTASDVTWSDKTVNDIVKNTIYKGERVFQGVTIPIEPIVSVQLFDECDTIRKNKTTRNYTTIYEYLLKDLLVCGICGRNYFARYKPQTIKGDKVYMCSSRLKQVGNCGNAGINISYIESVLYHLFITSGYFNQFVNDRTDLIKIVQTDLDKLNTSSGHEASNLQKKMNAVDRLLILYLAEKIDLERFDVQNSKLGKEIISTKKKIDIIQNSIIEQNKMKEKLESIHIGDNVVIGKNRSELMTIFNQFFDKIYITKLNKSDMLIDTHLSLPNIIPADSLKMLIDYTATKYKSRKTFKYHLLRVKFPISYPDGTIDKSPIEIITKFKNSYEFEVYEEDVIPLPDGVVRKTPLHQ